MNINQELLLFLQGKEYDCTAAEIATEICQVIDKIDLANDEECDKLGDWIQDIRQLICKNLGHHTWEFDQCGYWGHQYCIGCNCAKYPELGRLSCGEAIKKIGKIKEEDYNATI